MSDIDYSLYPLVYCLQPSPEKENHRRTTIKRTGTKKPGCPIRERAGIDILA